MKTYRWIILSTLASIAIVIISYLWATSLMDSLYAFRSPFAGAAPAAGLPVGKPLSRRVVAIMVDALRVDTAANDKVMPFLNRLRAQGASAIVHSGLPSYSAPSWSVLAIGAWQDLSDGPAMNPTLPENYHVWTQDNIYTSIHKAGLHTAVAGNQHFQYMIPPAAIDASAWTSEENNAADQENIDAAVRFIQSEKYDYVFSYVVQVDNAGHNEGGPLDPRWSEAATRADSLIEKIVGTLDLSKDTVLIYSDHGQIDAGGHGGQDAVVLVQPFIMAGANVKPGVYGDIQQVDIAPTTTVLLGAGIPSISQGHPLTDMLNLNSDQLAAIRQSVIIQQAGLYQAYATVMNTKPAQLSLEANQDPITVYQVAVQKIKSERLTRERLPRFGFISLLALIPAYILFRLRSRNMLWYFLAVVIYLAAFHMQYALLNGGTYSLSTVLSSSNLISTTAIYSCLAFLLAWLVASLGLRIFSMPRLQAVHTHLALIFIILYFIAIPTLWSLGYNGALVSWTLPDIGSMFLGFLFSLQLLVIAAVNLPLMAIMALATRKNKMIARPA